MSTPDDQPGPARREPSSRRGDDAEGRPGRIAWTLFAVWIAGAAILAMTSPDPPERWRVVIIILLGLPVIIAMRGPWPRV